tara:strand:- start:71 stop:610 length:540 start_codon:yes stop_codon:yes gene_type:complete
MSQSKVELPESQEDSIVSSEGEEAKANPFIPNTKAYWCASCKAHHDYDIIITRSVRSSSTGRSSTSYRYICKICGSDMFCPDDTVPWMYGLNGIGIICLAIGLGIGWSRGGFDFDNGSELIFLGFAAFFLLIGGMMVHYMRKWFAWSFSQRKKSAEVLEREAMNAPSAAEGDTAEKTEP